MIVPMKAVAIVMPSHERVKGLRLLAELGVVHLQQRPEAVETSRDLAAIQSAIRALEVLEKVEAPNSKLESGDGAEMAGRVNDLATELDTLNAQIAENEAELDRLRPLGDFDPAALAVLRQKGLDLRLYRSLERDLRSEIPFQRVGKEGSKAIIASTADPSDIPAGWQVFPLPENSPKELRDQLNSAKTRLTEVTIELTSLRLNLDHLNKEATRIEERHAFRAASSALNNAGPVTWLEGYCPEPGLPKIRALAEDQGWALAERAPNDEDAPPTLLQHKPWVDSINPIYQLISSLPGYREADVSLWFLVYLTVFFGILIGDAGYGLLMVGAALFARSKGLKGPVLSLLITLGMATTIWGALSGNWFGIQKLAESSPLSHLVIPSLNAWKTSSQETVMGLCFLVGATHLSIAHLIVAFRNRRSSAALSHLGWISILWGTWFVVRYLVLGVAISPLMAPLLITGVVLVIGFSAPKEKLPKRLGLGFGQLPLKLMNGFADLISYIRLFAVGMATLAVAASFNEIAGDVAKSGGILGWVLAAIVIFFGHGINLIMAALSVIVHGVRLNMMEFSSHAELTWSGTEYSPLSWREDSQD